MKKIRESPLTIYVAILTYGLLPRINVSVNLPNQSSAIRSAIILLVTISMLIITYQKLEKDKWEKINLGNMVLSAYILSILFTIFQLMSTAFL